MVVEEAAGAGALHRSTANLYRLLPGPLPKRPLWPQVPKPCVPWGDMKPGLDNSETWAPLLTLVLMVMDPTTQSKCLNV